MSACWGVPAAFAWRSCAFLLCQTYLCAFATPIAAAATVAVSASSYTKRSTFSNPLNVSSSFHMRRAMQLYNPIMIRTRKSGREVRGEHVQEGETKAMCFSYI